MNKIAVVGISASGKSIFARKLADKTGLPIFHMDKLFWKGNWEAVPEPEYLKEHDLLIQKDKWIIEGYIDKNMSDRLKFADMVIYLDYSGVRCAWQLIKRWVSHKKESRPELPKEAKEKPNFKFFWLVLTRGERKDVEEAIKIAKPQNLKIFHSSNQLNKFLKQWKQT